MTSAEVREELVRTLRLDLVGPAPGSPLEKEVLPQAPSRWYLTGFLIPFEAPPDQRSDETDTEEVDSGEGGGADDDDQPDRASARKAFFPSSLGISVLVPKETTTLRVRVEWGDYTFAPGEGPADAAWKSDSKEGEEKRARPLWQREPKAAEVELSLAAAKRRPSTIDVPSSGGLRLVLSVRAVTSKAKGGTDWLVPEGTRAVSVFLVNNRQPQTGDAKDEALVFQAGLTLKSKEALVPRRDIRGLIAEDWDEKVADLQYRDAFDFAVGHGVATEARVADDGHCYEVATTWIPRADVEKVEPTALPGVELSMEVLAGLESADAVRAAAGSLVEGYRQWVKAQRAKAPASGPRAETARLLLDRAESVAVRIEGGLDALSDPVVLKAFRLTNRVMAVSARQRTAQIRAVSPQQVEPPQWRPFQLAFLLMNLRGLIDPLHGEREIVDLLFFPTGGGKTEAYLGLAAFTLIQRRLRNPGISSAGVAVLMRYTLRLLTLDQLSRAATLICALELERKKDEEHLGTWPFEIGLWVGKAATPNKMGRKGDGASDTARARTGAYKADDKKPIPIPIENCPWCGTKFTPNSFNLVPNPNDPTDLRIVCMNRQCEFRGNRPLPIVAVDEPLYRRLPCFVIATVDKFASLPFEGRIGALFGKVDRADPIGFYGPCDPGVGAKLAAPLLPPELIIQDELHLISGPLGTMVGLYETVIDALATRQQDGHSVRPKIVASTATVRRADSQIRALFARPNVEVFPSPGPDRRDSYFARTVPTTETNGRLYLGLAAPGRSLKVVLLRSYLALLGAGQRLYEAEGGRKNPKNSVDPYMTLLGYFNTLRELGGSRRIVEDEITARAASYAERRRVGEAQGLFVNRRIKYEPVELTSREPAGRVSNAKRRLALPFNEDESVDVAMATNMISVGLDITRLGLMVVLGQPKTTSEYIQATSRVGRDDQKPGLVVTLLHVHKPRDRSHYERFEAYHASFYRAVEVTSVTPFAPRAIDRGLAGVCVALARHGWAPLTPSPSAVAAITERARLDFVGEALASRAGAHAKLEKTEEEALRQKVKGRVADLLDEWARIATTKRSVGSGLRYQKYDEATGPHLLYDPLDPELGSLPAGPRKFRANRSLRDVEASVGLWLRRLDGVELPEDAE